MHEIIDIFNKFRLHSKAVVGVKIISSFNSKLKRNENLLISCGMDKDLVCVDLDR